MRRQVLLAFAASIAAAGIWWLADAGPKDAGISGVAREPEATEDAELTGRRPSLVSRPASRPPAARSPVDGVVRGPALHVDVVAPDGAGVPGVEMQLRWSEPLSSTEHADDAWSLGYHERAIATDENGRASCTCVAWGATNLRVRVQTDRWVSRIRELDMRRAAEDGVRLDVVRACTVTGRAQLRDGTPATGREVLVRHADDAWPLPDAIATRAAVPFDPALAITSDVGAFRMTGLPPDALGLRVGSPIADASGEIVWLPAREPGTQLDDVVLVAPDTFFVTVELHTSDGVRLSGETVGLRAAGAAGAAFVVLGRTDSEGTVRLGIDTVGPWELVHLQPDGEVVLLPSLVPDGEPIGVTTRATPGTPLEVVVEHHDGRPATGIKIGLVSHTVAEGKADAVASWSITDREGRVELQVRGAAPWFIKVPSSDWSRLIPYMGVVAVLPPRERPCRFACLTGRALPAASRGVTGRPAEASRSRRT